MPESTSKSADSPQAAAAAGSMRGIRSALYQRRHLAVVQLLLIGPPLLMLLAGGVRSIFAYLSMDCFYYFVVARNMVELGFVSYDQFHPTNGFHPLWQAMTAAIYWPLWKADASSQAFVAAAFLASLALVSATLWTLHRILEHEYGTAGLLFLLFPAGAYGIASLFHSPHPFGALQTYANGMESGALLLAYALFLWGFIRYLHHPSRMVAVVTGVALGAVALARLDHALLAVTAVPVMAMSHLHKPERWAVIRHAVLAGLLAAGMLGLYLLWSRVVVGSWLPVSGVVKLGPPGETLRINVNEIRQSIAALFVDTGYLHRDFFLWRGLQLVLPLAMAVLYCAVAAIEAASRR